MVDGCQCRCYGQYLHVVQDYLADLLHTYILLQDDRVRSSERLSRIEVRIRTVVINFTIKNKYVFYQICGSYIRCYVLVSH